VLIRRSNPKQRSPFDRETPSRFTHKRCKEIGCASRSLAMPRAVRQPLFGVGRSSDDDPALDRLIKSADRHIRRRR
jgi:hypothetical protein